MPGSPGVAVENAVPFIFDLFLFLLSFFDFYIIIVVIPHYNSYP